MNRFAVLTLIGSNWENVWHEDDKPQTFGSVREARKEFEEHKRDMREADMDDDCEYKIVELAPSPFDLLERSYADSSQGTWVSRRTTFTKEDVRFATLAHNAMPYLLEAVRLLRVAMGDFPDQPNPFNGNDDLKAQGVLINLYNHAWMEVEA
jgi:hypothetical protein